MRKTYPSLERSNSRENRTDHMHLQLFLVLLIRVLRRLHNHPVLHKLRVNV